MDSKVHGTFLLASSISVMIHYLGLVFLLPELTILQPATGSDPKAKVNIINVSLRPAQPQKKVSTQIQGAIRKNRSKQSETMTQKITALKKMTGKRANTVKRSLTSKRKSSNKHSRRVQVTRKRLIGKSNNDPARQNPNNGDNRPPQYKMGSANNPSPPYPYLARKRGWEGRVVLRVLVSKSGYPFRVAIHKPSGHAILDKTAKATIERWKFKPSLLAGFKIEASVFVPVRFKLLN